jgi:preprotein translocase subunit SecF
MFVVNHRKIFYAISGTLVVLSLISLAVWHLNLGIDFTGGSLIEVVYSSTTGPGGNSLPTGGVSITPVGISAASANGAVPSLTVSGANIASRAATPVTSSASTASTTVSAQTQVPPTIDQINSWIAALKLAGFSARPSGDNDYIIRMQSLNATQHTQVLNALSQNGSYQLIEKSFNSVGPTLGKEAANKSIVSIILVIIAIVLFITFAFRQVSRPVSSWKYGLIAIVALLHDIIIPVGVFSVLGHVAGIQIDTLFITALLVILGFSIHDTIVVFDRVRENLRTNRNAKKTFSEIVGESINQTFARSINTSLTVLLSLLVLYFVGAASTQNFVLALLVGIFSGTYSSIFIGSPLLVTVEQWQNNKIAQKSAKNKK